MKRREGSSRQPGNEDATLIPKYTIGIVSQLLGLPPQVLRRFEAAGLLEPARQTGKNRLYTDQDIALLTEIAELAEQGVNVVGIRYILQMRKEVHLLNEEVHILRQQVHEVRIHRSSHTLRQRSADRQVEGEGQ